MTFNTPMFHFLFILFVTLGYCDSFFKLFKIKLITDWFCAPRIIWFRYIWGLKCQLLRPLRNIHTASEKPVKHINSSLGTHEVLLLKKGKMMQKKVGKWNKLLAKSFRVWALEKWNRKTSTLWSEMLNWEVGCMMGEGLGPVMAARSRMSKN